MAMTAGMLRKTDLRTLHWHGPEHIHWLAETWRRAFTVRNELLGDPAFGKAPPLQTLLSDAYLDKLAATISPDRATPSRTCRRCSRATTRRTCASSMGAAWPSR